MPLNKSQILIIGTISSAMLGIPDINEVFTEEIAKVVMQNPTPIMIVIVSLLKITLIILSFAWIIQLARNIQFTYEHHNEKTFNYFMFKLVATAIITLIVMAYVTKNL